MFIIAGFLLVHVLCSSCRSSIVMLQRSLLIILLFTLPEGVFRNFVPNYPLFSPAQHYYPIPGHGINLVEHVAYRSGLSAHVVLILLFTLVFSGILFACLSSVVAIRAVKYSGTEQKCRTRWITISKFVIVALPCIFYFSNNCLKPQDYQQVITLRTGASESLTVDNINQAVDELDRIVSSKAKQEIRACPNGFLLTYHKWLALWIYENWLDDDSVLRQKFREDGTWRTEDMACAVLKAFHSELNNEAEGERCGTSH
ncbi:hypothetical protein P9H32_11350 [Pontiella sp. NLcol2]|uniref:DUF6794 domain-containing protein n=2 Tax=Pontiella agarivorans TaxID=3038953 RepID=A0ABU5MYG9_9BACT|nr:hypothetical protein [Pontiella agarivorans]